MVGYHIIVERDKGRKTPEVNFSAQHFIYGMLAFTPSLHIYSTAEQSVGFSPIIFYFLAPVLTRRGFFCPKILTKCARLPLYKSRGICYNICVCTRSICA